MKNTNLINLSRLRLLFALLCCLPQFVFAAPQFLPPTSPASGHFAPGQSSPTPDYYTTANWANSPPIAKFVDTLPGLGPDNANNIVSPGYSTGQYLPVAVPDKNTFPGSDYYIIKLVEYSIKMHSDLNPTKIRGYVQLNANGEQVTEPHYLGPVIVATKDQPVRLKFINGLPTGAGGDLFIPVDESVMGAGEGPIHNTKYTQNRANIHLHGGRTPWISDGTPHQWIVPAGENTPYQQGVSLQNVPDMCFDASGNAIPRSTDPTVPYCLTGSTNPGPGASTYYFTNQQSTRLMFYHDHAFGITRLNVYAGMAAGYVITDKYEKDLVTRGVVPADMIPLIIQDKTFVNADRDVHPKSGGRVQTVRETDPLWNWGSCEFSDMVDGKKVCRPVNGDLWLPHVYMPAQLPEGSATGGVNPYGRWMYGPWFYPATAVTHGPVANPYYDPNCSSSDPFVLATCQTPGQPSLIPGTPNVSMGMEAFQDSVVVNGTVFPTLTVDPKPYRFRILNAASDRFWNLSFYVADNDPENVSIDTRLPADPFTSAADERYFLRSNQTEVKMAPASPALARANNWPARWPVDGREEMVPDPGFCQPGGVNCPNLGPDFIQIGTEGGFLPFPAVRIPQPVTYITDPTAFWVGVVDQTGLALGPAERADTIVDFSKYAGKTLILYNDAPAAWPARVPGYDYYTGAPDMRDSGGYGAGGVLDPETGAYVANGNDVPHGILPGYAPNSRTVMQVVVRDIQGSNFDMAKLEKEFTSAAPGSNGIYPAGQTLFERTQEPIIVGQAAYSSAYPDSYFPPNFPWEGVNQINDEFLQFVTLAGEEVKIPTEPKGIHDEMGASFDPEYGRMSGNLAMQLKNATTLNALLVLYGFSDIPTETVINSPTVDIQVIPGNPGTVSDGTQIWKISHNGVDTHPIHFHIFDVQLINRVGWDGQIAMPEPNELGWKDTVKISPLMDTIVAVRPRAPALPFGIPNSLRPLNPGIPIDSAMDFTTPPQVPGNSSWFLGSSFLTPFTGKYGFNSVDWTTGQAYVYTPAVPPLPAEPVTPAYPYEYYKGIVTNVLYDFGWEYVWHCHILSHEEMDMMRPIVLKVDTALPPAFSAAVTLNGGSVSVTWNDPTPVNYLSMAQSYDPANEVGFNIYRSADGITFSKLNATILPANSTSFTDSSPLSGSVYKVEAFNASGSTFSSVSSSAVVSLTATTAPFNAPATINLNASVSGIPLGTTVTSVNFYNGTTLLFSDSTAPYSYTWSDVMGGDYTVIAKATDSKGGVASASLTITVGSQLTADFNISNASIPAATDIGFCDAITLTNTTLGDVTSQTWSIGGTSSIINIPPSLPGVYPVTLTVTGTGNNLLPATSSVTKNVTVVNHPPNPLDVVTGGPYSVTPGSDLILNGSGTDSLDPCSTAPLTYAWNVDNKGVYDFFTADPTVTNAQVKAVLGAGTHAMTFKVTDSNGAATTATTSVSVLPAKPATITVPAASVNGSYTVSWTADSTPNVVFELQEASSLTPANWATIPDFTGTTNSYSVTGKADGSTFYYRVRAIAADGTLPTAYTVGANGCTTTFIAITNPANGGIVAQNVSTVITVALPPAPDGATLTSLQLYSGDNLQTTTPISANTFSWIPAVGVTSHTLTVRASYSNAQVSTSAAVTVQAGTATQTITLDLPANGAVFDLGTPITLQATPSATGAVISWVAFYDGTTRVDFTDIAPYTATYTPLTAGVKSLTAKAFYDNGLVATSAAKSVTINGQVIAPTSLTTTPTTTSTTGAYTVSWTSAVPATAGATFTLWESTDPTFATYTETLNAGLSASYTGKANGTYYYQVAAVKAPMAPSAWVGGQIVVDRPIYAGTLTPNIPSPQLKGATINFVASVLGGTGTPYEYEFWLHDLTSGAWTTVQNYSFSDTFVWDTNSVTAGNYELTVRVRNQGQTAYFQVSPLVSYTIIPSASLSPTSGSLNPSISSPQLKGANINFIATAQGGTGTTYEYEFWVQNLTTGAWSIAQNYSFSNTFAWNTSALPVGNYELTARIRNQGQTAFFQVSPTVSYIINSATPTSATLSAGVPSPQIAGTPITFTATGVTGGTGTPYEYEFWVQNLTTGAWSIAQNYSTVNTLSWNTASLSAGNYELTVRIRNQGQTQYFQVSPNVSYTLVAPAPTSGTLSAGTPPSPQSKGTTVSFTAGATGGTGTPYEYEFWVHDLSTGAWTIGQNYSTVNSFAWDTNPLSAVNYELTVRIRNQGQTQFFQVSPLVGYSLF